MQRVLLFQKIHRDGDEIKQDECCEQASDGEILLAIPKADF